MADQARALFKCIYTFAKHTALKLDVMAGARLCGEPVQASLRVEKFRT